MKISLTLVRCLCVGAAILGTGCASRRAPAPGTAPWINRGDSVESYIRKVRVLSTAAKPARSDVRTLESQDPEIQEGLQALALGATPAAHRRLADAYRQAGVLDAAYDHYSAALALDKNDAVSYDGLARIWRDWGYPELGIADARRAIFFAPASAAMQNTFGTLLNALGMKPEAERAFARAVALDPNAAYAWTNRCYLSLQNNDIDAAMTSCRRATALAPEMPAAHNNLGLVYAAAGDLALAAEEFMAAGGNTNSQHNVGSVMYNLGVVMTAKGSHSEAAAAFEAAQMLRPDWSGAAEKAQQSRRWAEQPAPAVPDVAVQQP